MPPKPSALRALRADALALYVRESRRRTDASEHHDFEPSTTWVEQSIVLSADTYVFLAKSGLARAHVDAAVEDLIASGRATAQSEVCRLDDDATMRGFRITPAVVVTLTPEGGEAP